MFGLGWQETIAIFVIALLLFGPKKLPELGKTIGKALTEFRRASNDLRSSWDTQMRELERETEGIKDAANDFRKEVEPYHYDSSHYDYDHGAYGYSGGEQAADTANSIADATNSTPSGSAVQAAGSDSSDTTAVAEAATPSAPADTESASEEKKSA